MELCRFETYLWNNSRTYANGKHCALTVGGKHQQYTDATVYDEHADNERGHNWCLFTVVTHYRQLASYNSHTGIVYDGRT